MLLFNYMNGLEDLKKGLYVFGVTLAFLLLGVFVYLEISQPPEKTEKLYSQALKAYEEEQFSKAYLIFSNIIVTSDLKPLALFHQGVCADKVGDKVAAIKQYKRFLLFYPKHELAMKVRYNLAQDLIDIRPAKAKRYFEQIIRLVPESDYAVASKYFLGVLCLKKYQHEKIFPLSAKNNIENSFRHYLKKAPSGKFALNAIEQWLSLGTQISKDDYLLMAKAYLAYGNFAKSREFAEKAELKNSWAVEVKNAALAGNNPRAIFLTEWGLNGNSDYVESEDLRNAIDVYLSLVPSKYQGAIKLLSLEKAKGKDYLTNIKCFYSPTPDKLECYKNLYLNYPESEFSKDAQAQIFLYHVRSNDLENAQRLGIDFVNKNKNSEYIPMFLYYLGRISEHAKLYRDYVSYYKSLLAKYPDDYYAYRAYLRLNHTYNPIIPANIYEKEVEYPYIKKNSFIKKLVDLKDYEVLDEYVKDDKFLKSWVLYQKGENAQAMYVAREAMDELQPKPDRRDLRWRLVYPMFYYDEIKQYASAANTNAALMLSIAREESYFNPKAQSGVGAKGLMQLMPQTASEIASQCNLANYDLLNPAQNIMLGNYYYSSIRKLLNGRDVSAVAAYNGGIGSVNQWKSDLNYSDTDSFIEQIPYPETKNYVKKVFRTYWNYVRLYKD